MEELTVLNRTPEGYEIDTRKSTFERIVYKKKVKNTKDFILNVGYYLNIDSNIIKGEGLNISNNANRNIVQTVHQAKALQILPFLCNMRDVYNKEPLEVWRSDNKSYFVIDNVRGELSVAIKQSNRKVMTFKTEELAREFIIEFKKELEVCKDFL